MDIPAQVTFRGMAASPAAEKRVREKIARLGRFSPDIVGCKVVLERRDKHHRHGNLFHVRIGLNVPGTELVVDHEAPHDHAHEDAYVAIRDAFSAAQRQLEDYARKRRGDTKTHGDNRIVLSPVTPPVWQRPSGNLSVGEAIHKRRAVRDYTSERLDEATVRELLGAAVRAPTALHEEPWQFVVVQDRRLIERISDEAKKSFAKARAGQKLSFDPLAKADFNLFYNASTLIVICAKPLGPFVSADCWLAAENLMLAACGMGLGTCVIGSAVAGLNGAKLKPLLGIPKDITVVAPIIVGAPTDLPPATPRSAPNVISWI